MVNNNEEDDRDQSARWQHRTGCKTLMREGRGNQSNGKGERFNYKEHTQCSWI